MKRRLDGQPELAGLPAGRVYDGELIAFGNDGLTSFPRLCQRMLHGYRDIPVMFVVFDLLLEYGEPLLDHPYRECRSRLEAIPVAGPHWATTLATEDGETNWRWVCEQEIEGFVAKRLTGIYAPASGGGSRSRIATTGDIPSSSPLFASARAEGVNNNTLYPVTAWSLGQDHIDAAKQHRKRSS